MCEFILEVIVLFVSAFITEAPPAMHIVNWFQIRIWILLSKIHIYYTVWGSAEIYPGGTAEPDLELLSGRGKLEFASALPNPQY